MNWKFKARLLHLISKLPPRSSFNAYYSLQRNFGALRDPNPITRLRAGAAILRHVETHALPIEGQSFLEIGTGRRLNLPVALWLCGASAIITVDVNPYLKPDLVFQDILFIKHNREQIMRLFANYAGTPLFRERFESVSSMEENIGAIFRLMNIMYLAPADAAELEVENQSVDYHVSYTVLEHIAPEIIRGLLVEGKRVVRDKGLFVHRIDLSDHFSHADKSISAINFLRYSERQWRGYAGNRYTYQNRLRIDDCVELFEDAGLTVVSVTRDIDERAMKELENGFPLHERFRQKPNDVNATRGAWIVARAKA